MSEGNDRYEEPEFPEGRTLCEIHGEIKGENCDACWREKYVLFPIIGTIFMSSILSMYVLGGQYADNIARWVVVSVVVIGVSIVWGFDY